MIEKRYNELCLIAGDINEHLPILKEYADKCNHITEMGVRDCVSLYAFLVSNAKNIVAIDIEDCPVPKVDKLKFILGDTLAIKIDKTDLLFIDTEHNYLQLKQELELHSKKVNKYIIFHDTYTFGLTDSNAYGRVKEDENKKGLIPAIAEFLEENKEWVKVYETEINNGLIIIEKNGNNSRNI